MISREPDIACDTYVSSGGVEVVSGSRTSLS